MKTRKLLTTILGTASGISLRLSSRASGRGVIINNHNQNGEQVRRQINALHPYFEFVHHDDLGTRNARFSKPPCLITFDDGKKINLDAADTLKKMGVPAVFFVVTGFVGGTDALWFDKLKALSHKLGKQLAAFGLNDPKTLSHKELSRRIDAAVLESDVETDLSDPRIAPLSWDEIIALDREGFTIGAHTGQHAILTNESPSDAKQDIQVSIRRVSASIGHPCQTFAFPNGNYTEELALFAMRCGVKTVMTTEPTWMNSSDPLHLLPRIQLHEKHSEYVMRAKLSLSRTGFLLNNPDGSGKQYLWRRLRRRAVIVLVSK